MTAVESGLAARRDEILQALRFRIPRPKLSLPYRLGLLLVAAVMVLLPLVYLALIGAACYGLYYHATESVVMFEGGGSGRGRLFAYLTPLIVGGILVFFMVKPLLAPRKRTETRVEFDREQQPFLYEFVDRLCQAVGAPAPRRILIDCEVNASAGFHQGGMGIASGGRELTIGLPLVGGMSIRNLAGVLAHEFGHFSQGTAMRLSFVVSAVNSWFARVVFERDDWDQSLVDWSQGDVGYVTIPAYLARGCVWLTRRVLFGLMWIGNVVSSNLSRQMEYDADSFEIHLAGSRSFAAAMTRIVELGAAHGRAMADLGESWEQRRLAADLPDLVHRWLQVMPDETRKAIHAHLENESTSLFASHPRSVDRIAAAEMADRPGVFDIDAPATVLFDDFDTICREATAKHYADMLGRRFKRSYLVPNEELFGERERNAAEAEAAHRFFQGTATVMVPLPVPEPESLADPVAAIRPLREQVVGAAHELQHELGRLVRLHESLTQNALAGIWIRAGVAIEPGSFGLDEASQDAVDRRNGEVGGELPPLEQRIAELFRPHSRRLGILAGVSPDLADGLVQLRATGTALPHLVRLRGHLSILSELFEHEPDEKQKAPLNRSVSEHAKALHQELSAIAGELGEAEYPFEHSKGRIPIREVALPRIPSTTDMEGLWQAAVGADDMLIRLHRRVVSRVAALGEEAEKVLGLEPLPELPAEPQGEED